MIEVILAGLAYFAIRVIGAAFLGIPLGGVKPQQGDPQQGDPRLTKFTYE